MEANHRQIDTQRPSGLLSSGARVAVGVLCLMGLGAILSGVAGIQGAAESSHAAQFADGTVFCGVVDTDTRWSLAGSPYLITCNSEVAPGVVLAIDPGVVIQLQGIQLAITGSLSAIGTDLQPITFTSTEASPFPGDWVRLWFGPGHGSSVLEHVVVEYAGRYDRNAVQLDDGALTVRDSTIRFNQAEGLSAVDAHLEIGDSLVSYNGGDGIRYDASSLPGAPMITGNSLVGNEGFAISLRSSEDLHVSPTIVNNSGSGNGVNGIFLDLTLGTTTLSENPGLPYVVQSVRTLADSALTIGAGTVFKADLGLSPGTLIAISGTVSVEGQQDRPVVFTSFKDDSYGGDTNGDGNSTQPVPGDWRGISVERPTYYPYQAYLPFVARKSHWSGTSQAGTTLASTNAGKSPNTTRSGVDASFSHAIIRYGGYGISNLRFSGIQAEVVNTTISHSASRGIHASDTHLSLTNSTVSDNGTDGVWLYGDTEAIDTILVDNVFSNNGDFAVYVIFHLGCLPQTEMHGNTGWGNGKVNGIYVEGALHEGQECRWGPNPQMPYVVWAVTVGEDANLELEPGVAVKFVAPTLERGTGTLNIAGTLQAEGTAEAPIAFTSFWDDTVGGDTDGTMEPAAHGDWIGLHVQGLGEATLDHTLIRYGGPSPQGYNLWATGAALHLTNSELAFGGSKGLAVVMSETTDSVVVRDNTFVGNLGQAATLRTDDPVPVSFDFANNGGTGNGVNGIQLDVTMDSMTARANPGLPYVIQSLAVAAGRTVTVDPGVVFKADVESAGGGGGFRVDGELWVTGTAFQPVFFTSLHDDAVGGDTLGDGGAIQPGPGDWRGVAISAGGQMILTHAAIRYAGYEGAALWNTGQTAVDHSYITDSLVGIGNLPDGVLSVVNTVISGNSTNGVSNGGSASITYSDIYGNAEYGVSSWAPGIVSAEHNYWGSADGPSWDGGYCQFPPQGSGDFVTCHSVDYDPFATAPYH